MRIKEVSKQTNLSEKSIRLYEEQGLISPAREMRNGRLYRDYSEEDVEELRRVAVLRKARFTMSEIRMMQEQPELVPAIYGNYLKRLRAEAAELSHLVRTAEQILPETMGSHAAVADAIAAGAESLPLPKRDVQPHFGKFDEETPEERAALFSTLRSRRRKQLLRVFSVVFCALIFCIALTVGIALYNCDTFFGAVQSVWPVYFLTAIFVLALLLSGSFIPTTHKSFLFTRQYYDKEQKPVDHVLIYDSDTNQTTVFGKMGTSNGNIAFSTKPQSEEDRR